jgi:iduronate 2-sulfatase
VKFPLLLAPLSFLLTSIACAGTNPNVLLICVDDLRPELGCYGKPYIQSPNIDRLAQEGRLFQHHFVQAPTCGASRYTLLTGRYGPSNNDALFIRAKRMQAGKDKVPPSMPEWFRKHGYTTVSVGKVSHHPGGRGGPDWNDNDILEMPAAWERHLLPAGAWQHPRGWMHGLANGEIRDGKMDVYQALEGPDDIYPDGIMIDEALRQIQQLADDEERPFFLAVGILRPHLPFGAPAKYLRPYQNAEFPPIPHSNKPEGKTTWHNSEEFGRYHSWGRDPNTDPEFATLVRKHYAACVSYADAQVGRLMKQLADSGKADNTIVVLWGDHGWHLGEHAVWGKHTLFEESLHAPLIIRHPGIKQAGAATAAMAETLSLFPTLCELAALPMPDFTQGTSLVPMLENPAAPGRPAVGYFGKARTIRGEKHRLIVHNDGHTELYDHGSPAGETRNVADAHPDLVERLRKELDARLAP